jgi:hypothetical protein
MAGVLVSQPMVAQAQFGGLVRDVQRSTSSSSGCEEGEKDDRAARVIGGILGGIGRRTARRAGVPTFVPLAQFTDTLTNEIACKLNEEEQEQAVEATLEATRSSDEEGTVGPEVGQTSTWTSNTREGVTGRSTVTAREETDPDDGSDCITVTDVVIIEGEETMAEKRMCRLAGAPRYTIVA